jgi:hypothetical protein
MSPLKQANPAKLIFDTIPNLLLEQFINLTQMFEKDNLKEFNVEKENEDWEMVYKEEFLEKNFMVFMHRKIRSRGKFIINFNEKTAQEIFAVQYFF